MNRKVTATLAITALGLAACAGILGLKKKAGPRPFEHRAHVLEGIRCTKCHVGMEKAGDRGPLHLPDTASCIACHKKPHVTEECRNCHGSPYTTISLTQTRKHLTFAHNKHMPIVKGNCVRCHTGVAQEATRLVPPMGACFSCHEHKDQFSTRECDKCHVDLASEAVKPATHLIHGVDFLREHGNRAATSADLCSTCHKQRYCASCHGATAPLLPSRRTFDRPDGPGMHRAGFFSRHSREAKAQPGTCSSCHRIEESCRGCHIKRGVMTRDDRARVAATPHPRGWVGITRNDHGRAARRDPANCASCHGGAGEMLCVGCHAVGRVGGNPHPTGWNSSRSKTELPCRLCHTAAR